VVAVAGSIAVPALIRIARRGTTRASDAPEHRLADAIRTAIGAGLVLAGLTVGFGRRTVAIALVLAAAGLALAGPAVRRLLPAGTLTARRGLPAAVLSRGLLTFTFFGADSFVTLSITMVRHYSPLVAGLAVTGATVTWTIGAWMQARLSDTWEARRLVRIGLVVILVGIAGMTLMLQPSIPIAEGIIAWTIAGLGMGLANSPLMLLVLRDAPEGRVGQASASVNLADVLGTATGAGIGGAAIAAHASSDLQLGIRIAFATAATMALVTLLTSLRLPAGRTSAANPAAESASG
jgi:hypothetical protein